MLHRRFRPRSPPNTLLTGGYNLIYRYCVITAYYLQQGSIDSPLLNISCTERDELLDILLQMQKLSLGGTPQTFVEMAHNVEESTRPITVVGMIGTHQEVSVEASRIIANIGMQNVEWGKAVEIVQMLCREPMRSSTYQYVSDAVPRSAFNWTLEYRGV